MPTEQASNLVLETLSDRQEYDSVEFMRKMGERGVTAADTRAAVAYLLSDHQVVLTPNRRLRRAA